MNDNQDKNLKSIEDLLTAIQNANQSTSNSSEADKIKVESVAKVNPQLKTKQNSAEKMISAIESSNLEAIALMCEKDSSIKTITTDVIINGDVVKPIEILHRADEQVLEAIKPIFIKMDSSGITSALEILADKIGSSQSENDFFLKMTNWVMSDDFMDKNHNFKQSKYNHSKNLVISLVKVLNHRISPGLGQTDKEEVSFVLNVFANFHDNLNSIFAKDIAKDEPSIKNKRQDISFYAENKLIDALLSGDNDLIDMFMTADKKTHEFLLISFTHASKPNSSAVNTSFVWRPALFEKFVSKVIEHNAFDLLKSIDATIHRDCDLVEKTFSNYYLGNNDQYLRSLPIPRNTNNQVKKSSLYYDNLYFKPQSLQDLFILKNYEFSKKMLFSESSASVILDAWTRDPIILLSFLSCKKYDDMVEVVQETYPNVKNWRDSKGNNIVHYMSLLTNACTGVVGKFKGMASAFPELMISVNDDGLCPIDIIEKIELKSNLSKMLIKANQDKDSLVNSTKRGSVPKKPTRMM